MNFRELARRMIDNARAEIRAELAAQRFPSANPIPMDQHLANLPPSFPVAGSMANLPPPDDEDDDEPDDDQDSCAHVWVFTGTAYGGDDPSYHGEGRCYCENCGKDGDG